MMKSKFVIIVCIGILPIFIFMTRPTGYIDDVDQIEIEKRSQTFKFKTQTVHMNDKPDHLFHFVQVCFLLHLIFIDIDWPQ